MTDALNVRILATDVGYAEGPVVTTTGDVLFTSIDRGLIYRIVGDHAEVFAETSGGPNGATEGPGGNIYVAQNGGSTPAHRTPEITGGVQVVRPGGKVDYVTRDLITPNDLCFGPDGYLYVTDPTRGASPVGPTQRRDDGRLWRCDVVTGETELLVSVGWYPNGIGFGIEDDALYVALTSFHDGDSKVMRFPIEGEGRLGTPEVFISGDFGRYDGFAFDIDGNLILSAIGSEFGLVQIYDREGKHLDDYKPGPSKYSNVALTEDRILYLTDSNGRFLAVDPWPTAGLRLHPFRGPQAP
jgi:gluconolactonase